MMKRKRVIMGVSPGGKICFITYYTYIQHNVLQLDYNETDIRLNTLKLFNRV